jgi:Flp pilus assembly protein TadD
MDEAIMEARNAQKLDPVSLTAGSNVAIIFYYARQYDQAIEQALKTLELDSKFARLHEALGFALEQKGIYEGAIAEFEKAVALSGRGTRCMASLAHTYALAGNRSKATRLLGELKQLSKRKYVSPFTLALVLIGLGKTDEAFDWLEKAYQEHSSALPFF